MFAGRYINVSLLSDIEAVRKAVSSCNGKDCRIDCNPCGKLFLIFERTEPDLAKHWLWFGVFRNCGLLNFQTQGLSVILSFLEQQQLALLRPCYFKPRGVLAVEGVSDVLFWLENLHPWYFLGVKGSVTYFLY